ncbi:NAD(P)H-dependent oxidoreductase [Psychroserpens sp. SPM9]|uniref:NAD(P)H-dependent oxidoreductase n=1 Tax=Psychroserpens sp. SPM9 TaxID=2975598 RepID=UPI0021A27766|nr:NAD(P)H-dependent oxidoreductase [Psychroserpens sp. SPM9]MDG5492916.1 NAD(P)H-dependent oxidoreductase [Psychroserpens sp. SPM9]
MKNIFIINGWHEFAISKGTFNKSLFDISKMYFTEKPDYTIKTTEINKGYHVQDEVEKFIWSDLIIYHTPIWWFSVPFNFKKYLDEVLTAGYNNGMWTSDGRNSENPEINYGTGGLLHGKQYMLTTSWNAPEGAFTLPDEFFNQISVDNGPLSGFHGMKKYLGIELHTSLKFHDVEKNADTSRLLKGYKEFLEDNF